jgi:hypothetical protein
MNDENDNLESKGIWWPPQQWDNFYGFKIGMAA